MFQKSMNKEKNLKHFEHAEPNIACFDNFNMFMLQS